VVQAAQAAVQAVEEDKINLRSLREKAESMVTEKSAFSFSPI